VIQAAGPASVPPTVLYRILRLRCEVFVVEQACAYLDLDGRDLEPATVHVWADPDPAAETVAAALRVLAEPGDGRRIGRVATAPGWRRKGLAAALMDHALGLCGDAPVVLDAQAHLAGWYERLGFERSGAEFVEDGIPHVPMRRRPPG
jgi:ElaA protein